MEDSNNNTNAESVKSDSFSNPYSETNFREKLSLFHNYIDNITFRSSHEPIDERQKRMLEHLRFDQFCDNIRIIFKDDFKGIHLKNVFKKVCQNPNIDLDWSEVKRNLLLFVLN
jgi:hypothetical protein